MKRRVDYPERTIITTWQISFDEVERRDIGAAKLLRLWGYLDNQELWYQLLRWPIWENAAPDWLQQITATEISFLATVGTLSDFSLIEQNDNSETYSMHAVVHDWIQASIDTRKDDGILQTAITTIGLAVPEENTRDSITIQRRLLPHLIQLLQYWSYVTEVQDYVDNAVYLESLQMLGNLCADQDKLVEAEKMYQRALQGYEKALGPDHTSTLDTVNNLGLLYADRGKLDEAEKMYQRALQGYEKALGPDNVTTCIPALNTIWAFGYLFEHQADLAKARIMYSKALVGYEKVVGPDHPRSRSLRDNLRALDTVRGQGLNRRERAGEQISRRNVASGC
jgi:hypothetical protein